MLVSRLSMLLHSTWTRHDMSTPLNHTPSQIQVKHLKGNTSRLTVTHALSRSYSIQRRQRHRDTGAETRTNKQPNTGGNGSLLSTSRRVTIRTHALFIHPHAPFAGDWQRTLGQRQTPGIYQ